MHPDFRFLDGHEVVVYTAGWCPDCQRLKRWLGERGLSFGEVDIDADPRAALRLEEETGKRAIPFLLIDARTWVRGYHKELPTRFDPRLLASELRAAVSAPAGPDQ